MLSQSLDDLDFFLKKNFEVIVIDEKVVCGLK